MAESVGDGMNSNFHTKGQLRPVEQYLPSGYPQFLFHGTRPENSNRAHTEGLGGGSLTSNIIDSFGDRFYARGQGRLIVTPYDKGLFETEELGGRLIPYQYFHIRDNTGPRRDITFTRVDTDHAKPEEKTMETTSLVPTDRLGCLSFTEKQHEYIYLISDFIDGKSLGSFDPSRMAAVAAMLRANNLPDSAAGAAGEGVTMQMLRQANIKEGDDNNYRKFMKQKRLAEVLGLEITNFASWESLEQAVAARFPTEEAFIDTLTAMFPRASETAQLNWEWNNLGNNDNEIVRSMLQQMYQVHIVTHIKSILEDNNEYLQRFIRFPQSTSARGLDQLQQERGLA